MNTIKQIIENYDNLSVPAKLTAMGKLINSSSAIPLASYSIFHGATIDEAKTNAQTYVSGIGSNAYPGKILTLVAYDSTSGTASDLKLYYITLDGTLTEIGAEASAAKTFYATYGSTTYSEIQNAHNNKAAIYAISSDNTVIIPLNSITSSSCIFSYVDSTSTLKAVTWTCSSADVWNSSEAEISSKLSTYSKEEIDTFLAAKQAKLESGTNIATINNLDLLQGKNLTVGTLIYEEVD